MDEDLKVYHAFSNVATNQQIDIGGKKMPIIIADHSVVYLPMEKGGNYAVFNGASIHHDLKGIKSASAIAGLSISEIDKELDTNIKALIKAGVKTIIQPGGSIRDREAIDAADKAKIKMVFTSIRHFNH